MISGELQVFVLKSMGFLFALLFLRMIILLVTISVYILDVTQNKQAIPRNYHA